MKLSQLDSGPVNHVCVFGPPKSGKTELVGKLALHFNLLWFDLEEGWKTLLKLPQEAKERVELIRIPDKRSFPIAAETMPKVIKGSLTKICEAHGKVSCALCLKDAKPFTSVELNKLSSDTIVVLDSGTQLANSVMAHITKNQPEDYKYEWDDYRKQGTQMDLFLSEVQQATFNFVFITHEAEVEMEDGRKKIVPVAGTTNFSRNTAKYFDHIVYCNVKNLKHTFSSKTTDSNMILTGSRLDFDIASEAEQTLLAIFQNKIGKVVEQTQGVKAVTNLAKFVGEKK